MKRYASPGVDSVPEEVGIYNSGAAQSPERNNYARAGKIKDWISVNPVAGLKTGKLIGTSPATQVPPASALRIRHRGISPWGGYVGNLQSKYANDSADSMLNVGGSVDHNAGASSLIAGGVGAASSMVRMYGRTRKNRGAKLPVLPPKAERVGAPDTTSGGQHGMVSAPLVPQMLGLPSIIKVNTNVRPAPVANQYTIRQKTINAVKATLPARAGYQNSAIWYDYTGNLLTVTSSNATPPRPWAFGFSRGASLVWTLRLNSAYRVVA